jgi:hypothetical protein
MRQGHSGIHTVTWQDCRWLGVFLASNEEYDEDEGPESGVTSEEIAMVLKDSNFDDVIKKHRFVLVGRSRSCCLFRSWLTMCCSPDTSTP